jgi:hypothetical protein
MSDENYKNIVDGPMQNWIDAGDPAEVGGQQYIRISNERYAKDSTLDDRLSLEDRQMLSDMGIAF